ncbi:MAG: endonuclease domain-containing protein [Dehalococcoidales bacterium]
MKNALTNLAKGLRARQTEAETVIWYKICNRQLEGAKFRRQQQVGDYIADFVCFEKKVIIEIDGGQHNETPNKERDEQRTRLLEQKGYRVLRFWNNDVLQNTEGVLYTITEILKQRVHPHLASPVKGEE